MPTSSHEHEFTLDHVRAAIRRKNKNLLRYVILNTTNKRILDRIPLELTQLPAGADFIEFCDLLLAKGVKFHLADFTQPHYYLSEFCDTYVFNNLAAEDKYYWHKSLTYFSRFVARNDKENVIKIIRMLSPAALQQFYGDIVYQLLHLGTYELFDYFQNNVAKQELYIPAFVGGHKMSNEDFTKAISTLLAQGTTVVGATIKNIQLASANLFFVGVNQASSRFAFWRHSALHNSYEKNSSIYALLARRALVEGKVGYAATTSSQRRALESSVKKYLSGELWVKHYFDAKSNDENSSCLCFHR